MRDKVEHTDYDEHDTYEIVEYLGEDKHEDAKYQADYTHNQ